MIVLGPYSFSLADAERVVGQFDALWDGVTAHRDADAVNRLVPTFTGDLAADLAAAWHALLAAGPALRTSGQLPATAVGRVAALHVSDGGVPKSAREHLEVSWSGARGDRQNSRKHHGAPFQALCLWSGEVIDALAADGHPIAPGLAGENITVRGLQWGDVRPGVRLRVGTVLCEVSSYAVPCRHLAQWFSDGRFDRIHHDKGTVSRVYATVLEPGEVSTGDAVVLEPPAT
ncbi:MAG: MOSC domain-containing protein [Ilumatobacteraceae bacterium]